MRRLCAAFFLLFSLVNAAPAQTIGQPNQVACNSLAFQAASTASLATLVAGAAGKTIFICGWHVSNSNPTAANFTLSYGTGTNCGTTNVAITPPITVSQNAPATDHIDYASISLPIGANLCIISSTTTLQPGVWVGQY